MKWIIINGVEMTNAIVMSLDKNHLLASPTGAVDLQSLKGIKVKYLDSSDREWFGIVEDIEEDYLVIKFDKFPGGLGQGQIIEILDGSD